jgi:hypothetical protein
MCKSPQSVDRFFAVLFIFALKAVRRSRFVDRVEAIRALANFGFPSTSCMLKNAAALFPHAQTAGPVRGISWRGEASTTVFP